MPISFTIRAMITTSLFSFEPTFLDFGVCCLNEGIKLPVCVTNQSLLEQKIGFVGLPPEVTVGPQLGFATMLPQESTTFEVEFHPSQAKEYNLQLKLHTDRNEEYVLAIRGIGKYA